MSVELDIERRHASLPKHIHTDHLWGYQADISETVWVMYPCAGQTILKPPLEHLYLGDATAVIFSTHMPHATANMEDDEHRETTPDRGFASDALSEHWRHQVPFDVKHPTKQSTLGEVALRPAKKGLYLAAQREARPKRPINLSIHFLFSDPKIIRPRSIPCLFLSVPLPRWNVFPTVSRTCGS